MLKRYNGVVGVVLRAFDVVVVTCSWLVAYDLRFWLVPFAPADEIPDFYRYASLAPMIGALWLITFTARGLYTSRRLTSLWREWQDVLRAQFIAVCVFLSITYLFEHYRYSRLMIGYFAIISSVGLGLARVGLRLLMREVRARGFNIRRILVIGTGGTAARTIDYTENFPELGLQVVGVIALDPKTAPEAVAGKPVVGSPEDLPRLLSSPRSIDEVIVALPSERQRDVDRILHQLKDETVDVRIIPDVDSYATLGCTVDEIGGMPVVRINDSPLAGWGAPAKRMVDIVGAFAALLLLSPVMAVVAVLVKVTSEGPILYAQERMGLDGRTFQMLKFRSMKVDAERTSGAVWAQAIDDRRTPIGTFLRKTSLDELPQFWNVLVGDMSLVGPRPERPVFVAKFRGEIPHYMLRHKVKAGITGWAQINGWRGNTSLDRRIECDLFYIRNWSLSFDLRILVLTFWKGFVNENAY